LGGRDAGVGEGLGDELVDLGDLGRGQRLGGCGKGGKGEERGTEAEHGEELRRDLWAVKSIARSKPPELSGFDE
jgi:hypothetical protein